MELQAELLIGLAGISVCLLGYIAALGHRIELSITEIVTKAENSEHTLNDHESRIRYLEKN